MCAVVRCSAIGWCHTVVHPCVIGTPALSHCASASPRARVLRHIHAVHGVGGRRGMSCPLYDVNDYAPGALVNIARLTASQTPTQVLYASSKSPL